jgi:hypothetical protein
MLQNYNSNYWGIAINYLAYIFQCFEKYYSVIPLGKVAYFSVTVFDYYSVLKQVKVGLKYCGK